MPPPAPPSLAPHSDKYVTMFIVVVCLLRTNSPYVYIKYNICKNTILKKQLNLLWGKSKIINKWVIKINK